MVNLYEYCWKDYIDDYYSVQNKGLTLYLTITPALYVRLKMNPLVNIEGVAYEVLNIEYDVKTRYAKVVVRQIYDVLKLSGTD